MNGKRRNGHKKWRHRKMAAEFVFKFFPLDGSALAVFHSLPCHHLKDRFVFYCRPTRNGACCFFSLFSFLFVFPRLMILMPFRSMYT